MKFPYLVFFFDYSIKKGNFPHLCPSLRWQGDSRLRCRDKSVENLKSLFTQKIEDAAEEPTNVSSTSLNKDHYRLYWRPKSASDLTRTIEQEQGFVEPKKPVKLSEDRFTTYPRTRHSQSPYQAAMESLTQQRSRSSLSIEQVSTLKNQLNQILSAKNSAASSAQSSRSPSRAEQYSIEVKDKTEPLQSLGLFVKPIPDIVRRSQQEASGPGAGTIQTLRSTSMTPQRVALKPRSRSKEEEERLRVSKTINAELMKKVNFRESEVQKEPRYKIQNQICTF